MLMRSSFCLLRIKKQLLFYIISILFSLSAHVLFYLQMVEFSILLRPSIKYVSNNNKSILCGAIFQRNDAYCIFICPNSQTNMNSYFVLLLSNEHALQHIYTMLFTPECVAKWLVARVDYFSQNAKLASKCLFSTLTNK